MLKIPTVFVRDPFNIRRVLPEVNPVAAWVLTGEGIASRMHNGACVMFDGENWWSRRTVKILKAEPPGWVEIERDSAVGKRIGWEPVEQVGFHPFFVEALESLEYVSESGTYACVGPRINSNPERLRCHRLIKHTEAEQISLSGPLSFDYLQAQLLEVEKLNWEGIVWRGTDNRLAKLRVLDFTR